MNTFLENMYQYCIYKDTKYKKIVQCYKTQY